MKNHNRHLATIAAGTALLLLTACSGGTGQEGEPAQDAPVAGDLDALIAAAQEEGELVLYSSSVDLIDNTLTDAFEAEYGIPVVSTKLTSNEVAIRYQSEASAGRVLADIVASTCTDEAFFGDIVESGYAVAASELELPGLGGDGQRYFIADGAGFQYVATPVAIGYNSELLTGSDAPDSWEDLTDPKYKGKIVMVDPESSAFYGFWLQWAADTFGEEYIEALASQDLSYADAGTARNQLGAGQFSIDIPTFAVSMEETAASGAPVAAFAPESTSANFSCIGVSAPDKAPHPNAAQLYAHFVSSPAAAQAFEAALPSVISPFGESGIPETITPLPTESDNEHLLALLGR